MYGRYLSLVVAAGVAGLLGWMVRAQMSEGPGGPAPASTELRRTGEPDTSMDSLREEIRRLAAKVDRLSSTVHDVVDKVPRWVLGQELSNQGEEDLVARLEALQTSMDKLTERIRENFWFDPPPSLGEIRGGKPSADWREFDILFEAYRIDKGKAMDHIRGMTYSDVLARFGPPVSMKAQGVWYYERERQEGGPVAARLFFVGGYVAGCHFVGGD